MDGWMDGWMDGEVRSVCCDAYEKIMRMIYDFSNIYFPRGQFAKGQFSWERW
jgi:hypothetical protein